MNMKANNALIEKHRYNPTSKQTNLLISDLHLDSIYCKKNLLKRHLNQALELDARIFIFGDLFDAMQGKNDKRSNRAEMKNLNLATAYFNDIIDQNYEFLKPYQKNIALIGYGNHETSIIRHNDIDVLDILCSKLGVVKGSYAGFVRFQFEHTRGGARRGFTMYYDHGSGGEAPVTKGIIDMARANMIVEADIIAKGHNHNRFDVDNEIMFLNQSGNIELKKQVWLRTGTYKQEFSTDGHGFMIEKGNQLKPIGGHWLDFYVKEQKLTYITHKTD